MRKLALLAAALCLGALSAGAASAAAPETYAFDIADTFMAPFLSEVCGIPVSITIAGTAHVTVFRNEAGLVVSEIDRVAASSAVFTSPVELGGTGLSFTNRSPLVASFDYGDGAVLGGEATVTLLGMQGYAAGPGSSVAAGNQVLEGTVVDFSPEGIPIVLFGDVLVEHGRFPDFFTVGLPERCAALGGSLG